MGWPVRHGGVNFLIDECLHSSLVAVALGRGHEASHVIWLGLAGEADWDLMKRVVADDLTFVTNNARDFRRLFAREPLHAGLVIVVPQVVPARQRELFAAVLDELAGGQGPVNEVVEIELSGDDAVITRYGLPA